ncbi:hypothetical protein FJW06_15615 [Mesorhizobium sp. B4-1-3]|nr:hypothetical protein FJW06_15615 [Mesorhizobium sp. B4-1-3]
MPSSGFAVTTSKLAVIYPPEFLFVLDVGLDCLVGGSVFWNPIGYGDPGFPEKNEIALRSIRKRTEPDLIFPSIAGSLMMGLKEGTPDGEVKDGLIDNGLQDVMLFGTFATANCKPFQEPTICRDLEAALPFLKYAEQNTLRRIIDFAPGWVAKRLV